MTPGEDCHKTMCTDSLKDLLIFGCVCGNRETGFIVSSAVNAVCVTIQQDAAPQPRPPAAKNPLHSM